MILLDAKAWFTCHCRGWGIDWRKLVLVACVMTTAGALLQLCAMSDTSNIWHLFPPVMVSSFNTLNSTVQVGESLHPQATVEQFPPVPTAPFNLKDSIVSPVSLSDVENVSGVSSTRNPARQGGDLKVMAQPVGNVSSESSRAKERGGTENLKNNRDPKVLGVWAQPIGNVSSDSNRANEGGGAENLNNGRDPKVLAKPAGNVSSESNLANEGGGTENLNNDRDPKVMAQPRGNVPAAGKSTRSSHSGKPIWSMSPDQALLYVKKEIENAPAITDDPDLHAPIFRNISVFKRSYELMEKILKVYIYKDGPRPIFHTPQLRGIYASEGWFLKLMEENRWFVVSDPNRAHLFYLPYSARQLEVALYVPDSHNMRPLSVFLKDYVNMLAAKYPFWNRTRGSDHFLVACHDWGPYTTTAHDELCKNTIKALCNADASEGIFIPGKDVSLPETLIRTPRRPLRDLGGKPISLRSILAFFAGNMHGRVRPTLLKYWEGKDEDMKIYGPLPNRITRKMSYIQHMKSSKFCICPMGYEVNSPRIVEAIYFECVPVIIADNFVPPLYEVLDWSAFSVTVAEKDIPNLKEILLKIPLRRYISMQTNVKRLQKHFLWHSKPIKYDMFHMILHSIWFNRLNQIQIQQQ
ncbi:probable glycosyltransferase At5g03795 [Magnolia sinica]|uniref:probable glycosyltransferase At5g03795 n=1 Tax=Magnolia sinica TaxID=86752 RepID=UPI00265AE464|nr:probable glycosyltransferase At5g03795 [Magnolia sinica]